MSTDTMLNACSCTFLFLLAEQQLLLSSTILPSH